MIEWLAGLAIVGGVAAYKNYKNNNVIRSVIEDLKDDIDTAYNDIRKIKRNYKYYFNYKKLSDWSIKHEHMIEQIKSVNPKKLQRLYPDFKALKTIRKILKKNIHYRNKYNDFFIEKEKKKYQKYFDTMFDIRLTDEQREAVVKDEDVNYINAGAGTGKTTTILAKVKYLVEKKKIKEDKILLLTYNKDVEVDINNKLDKMGLNDVDARTFHGFGYGLLRDSYNKKRKRAPDVFIRDERSGLSALEHLFQKLKNDKDYLKKLTDYFLYYLKDYKPDDEFENEEEYEEYNVNNRSITIMNESVKSHEELLVANTLYKWGIEYQYERKYEHELPDFTRKNYEPDFYLTDYGIYLEHFALNRAKDEDGNTVLEEFFPDYLNNHNEKLQIHKEYKTKLIKTYSQDIKDGTLLTSLKKQLIENGVVLKPRSSEEILDKIKETSNFSITLFTKFIETFLSHFKSHDTTISALRDSVDEIFESRYSIARTKAFLELFEGYYKEYEKMLKKMKKIDFEDMINEAKSILDESKSNRFSYKYIFVDEFQDITIGRHHLLKKLMHKSKFPKLLVVGDDWQSIYKFAGGEVDVLMNFKKYYGKYFSKSYLTETFRFGKELAAVSNNFIKKNPNQEQKQISASKSILNPMKFIEKDDYDDLSIMYEKLQEIESIGKKQKKQQSVLILNRYKKMRQGRYVSLVNKYKRNKFVSVKFLTAHRSKGLTFDYVFLDDVMTGRLGFPSNMADDSILYLFLKGNTYPYEEERRLFYVAITRTKKEIFIMYKKWTSSIFVKEVHNYLQIACENCGNVMNNYPDHQFYGCPDFRRGCDYKVNLEDEKYHLMNELIITKEEDVEETE